MLELPFCPCLLMLPAWHLTLGPAGTVQKYAVAEHDPSVILRAGNVAALGLDVAAKLLVSASALICISTNLMQH